MYSVKRNIRTAILVSIALFFITNTALTRDIDLDSIYIKKSSPQYQKLAEAKFDAYRKANSRLIDRDVVFAEWTGGFDILYVKETKTVHIALLYNRITRKSMEIFRFTGTPTIVKITPGGRYCLVKRITIEESGLPRGDGFCFDTVTKTKRTLPGSYPFLDFSLSPSGASMLNEAPEGIMETDLATGLSKSIMPKKSYAGIVAQGSPSILFLSPNRSNSVLLSGSGGNYNARITFLNKSWAFGGPTSSSEFFWISNHAFVFRGGGPGGFSVSIYDIKTRSLSNLMDDSLHTSINYSPYAKVVSFLKDQVIHSYSLRDKSLFNTGLEGDDVFFSPDGNRFISLLYHRLFMSDIVYIMKNRQELNAVHRTIADLYKNLQSMKSYWENDYTPVFISRKLALYK